MRTGRPPTLHTAVPNWSPGDTIPLGRDRTLRVIEVRDDSDGGVLVVESGLRAAERRGGASVWFAQRTADGVTLGKVRTPPSPPT